MSDNAGCNQGVRGGRDIHRAHQDQRAGGVSQKNDEMSNAADVLLFLALSLAVIAVAVMLVQSYFSGSEPPAGRKRSRGSDA